jgi:large subunit ribosomal protein L30
MAQITLTLTKSPISRIPVQRKTVKALGLGKMGSSVVKEDTAAIRAMVASVGHLVTITEAAADKKKAAKKAAPKAVSADKPTSASKVAEIKAYLNAEGIAYPADAKKADLVALIK